MKDDLNWIGSLHRYGEHARLEGGRWATFQVEQVDELDRDRDRWRSECWRLGRELDRARRDLARAEQDRRRAIRARYRAVEIAARYSGQLSDEGVRRAVRCALGRAYAIPDARHEYLRLVEHARGASRMARGAASPRLRADLAHSARIAWDRARQARPRGWPILPPVTP